MKWVITYFAEKLAVVFFSIIQAQIEEYRKQKERAKIKKEFEDATTEDAKKRALLNLYNHVSK